MAFAAGEVRPVELHEYQVTRQLSAIYGIVGFG